MRIFSQNGAFSSGIDRTTKESFFRYIIELRRILLENKYKKILVIGAAGFTLPRELALDPTVERVDVVDVDESLPQIAETYFLSERLSPKIHFFPESARYFLRNAKEQYDAIVVDVYVGKSLP
jgi:spermidine synthase